MLAALGFDVMRLIRVAIGPLPLGERAKGQYRHLSANEVRALARPSTRLQPARAMPPDRSWSSAFRTDEWRQRERSMLERVLPRYCEHLGEPTRATGAAPIRYPPVPARDVVRDNAPTWRAEPEAAVDAPFLDPMPDYENQRQVLNW